MTTREAIEQVWMDPESALEEIAAAGREDILDELCVVIPAPDRDGVAIVWVNDSYDTMMSPGGEFWQTFEMASAAWVRYAANIIAAAGFSLETGLSYQVDAAMLGTEWNGNARDLRELCAILQDVVGPEIDIVAVNSHNGAINEDDYITEAQFNAALEAHYNAFPGAWDC